MKGDLLNRHVECLSLTPCNETKFYVKSDFFFPSLVSVLCKVEIYFPSLNKIYITYQKNKNKNVKVEFMCLKI